MRLIALFASCYQLIACTLSGGFGYHNTEYDSEFIEKPVVGWFQGDVPLTDNINLYARHESQPFYREKNNGRGGGFGANTFGISGHVKVKELFK